MENTNSKLKIILDSCKPNECHDVQIEEALKEIKFSENCLVVYSSHDSKVHVLFTGYNKHVLHDLIVAMCYHDSYLKLTQLAVLCAEKIKKLDKKGMDFAEMAGDYVEKNFGTHINNKG